jgi:enoyl-CoA hydratase/carnithine racemase
MAGENAMSEAGITLRREGGIATITLSRPERARGRSGRHAGRARVRVRRDARGQAPVALSLIKSGLNRSSTWAFEEALEFEAAAQAQCLGSDDFREALKAFFQKRSGTYTGR